MDKALTKKHTQDMISLALYQLILKKPYDQISVKEICDKATVSRMSFYRYYSKKDDIFIGYCDERFAEFYEDFKKVGNPTINTFVYKMFQFFDRYSRQLNILRKANREQLLMHQFKSYSIYMIKNIKPGFGDMPNGNPVISSFLSGGFFSVLMDWLDNKKKDSPEKMTEYIMQVFSRAR